VALDSGQVPPAPGAEGGDGRREAEDARVHHKGALDVLSKFIMKPIRVASQHEGTVERQMASGRPLAPYRGARGEPH
jgi:hypothetical protein